MSKNFTVCSEDELTEVINALQVELSKGKSLVLLKGDLGSGKTTLVKKFVGTLDPSVLVDSPTFSLVNTYAVKHQTIHHFDLYRLEEVDEIEDIGFWEYVDSNAPCFIEWPDKIAHLLPENKVLNVDIALTLNQCRVYSLS